ncbi:MAG: PIN domain-containing protein [Candidatus Cloacimonetes bacterium]|nr:PIN domain-containing protein [Candidatus Cloacimonadota bacterium]
MNLLISDTCILIDLYNGELLDSMCRLPYELGVSDAVLSGFEDDESELIMPNPEQILRAGFKSYSISSEELAEVYKLYSKYSRPSIYDIFGLVVAKKYNAILLTGDGDLRESAKSENIEIRGIIWVLDELIKHEVIDKHRAANSLRKILDSGSYLPKKECDLRFDKWK